MDDKSKLLRSADKGRQPRLIIHGGAGNITRATMTPERCRAYRAALTEIINRTGAYMTATPSPSALEIATFATVLFEDDPLFNSGHGAVFTRDGINELEASVMVSRGHAKRGVGVMGLHRVKNPILLARSMLEHGEGDLRGTAAGPDVPSAQGHTQLYGAAAEALAEQYGLPLVDPSYFFTQNRWDEHVRGLERERSQTAVSGTAATTVTATSSWSPNEYLPQGTCGAVALDVQGVLCCATTTGGLTNKLTGRVGDTPVIGAGSWAETWSEVAGAQAILASTSVPPKSPLVTISEGLCALLADCFPIWPSVPTQPSHSYNRYMGYTKLLSKPLTASRSLALSGTGNGDSFLRVSAAHTVVAMARYRPMPGIAALSAVAGPDGILQQSAGDRWGRTGEGEGGMIGIESVVVQDEDGNNVRTDSTVIAECNCGGMFRAWIDDDGIQQVRIFRDD